VDEVSVLVALRGAIEEHVLREIQQTRSLTITRRCADATEVLAAALAGIGDVAVVDIDLGVDRSFVLRLRKAGVIPVIYAPTESASTIENLAAVHLSPETDNVADFLVQATTTPVVDDNPTDMPVETLATLIAVMSPWGSPGRTTVAVNLAYELAQRGGNPLLIDADVWGGSIKQYLGLNPDGVGIAAAMRAVERGTFDMEALQNLCEVDEGVHVLGGMTKAHRWREAAGQVLQGLWDTVGQWGGCVVIDAPVFLPTELDDPVSGFGPSVNDMWHSIRDHATEVCLVGTGDTIGMHRIINFHLDGFIKNPYVVINRIRQDAAGPSPQAAVNGLLDRFAGISNPLMVPEDPAVDQAILGGQPLVMKAPKSPARQALIDLADCFHPRRQRKRKRRGIGSWVTRKEHSEENSSLFAGNRFGPRLK